MARYIELIIVLVAALMPTFLLAAEVDGDEFAKAGSGIATAGVCVAIYKIWAMRQDGKPITKLSSWIDVSDHESHR